MTPLTKKLFLFLEPNSLYLLLSEYFHLIDDRCTTDCSQFSNILKGKSWFQLAYKRFSLVVNIQVDGIYRMKLWSDHYTRLGLETKYSYMYHIKSKLFFTMLPRRKRIDMKESLIKEMV